MTINFPTSQQEILNRIIADIQNELPEAGPFLRNNFVYALATANSARMFDNYQLLKELIKQMFPDTASGDYLDRWGGYKKIFRLPATKSRGLLTITGLVDSVIPIGSEFQTTDGRRFVTESAGAIGLQSFIIDTLTRSGNTVTVTTVGPHNIATGMSVNIEGAEQNDYNGEFTVIVNSATQFIYNITPGLFPLSPATGTIKAFFYGTGIRIESVETGSTMNLESGTQLNLVTPLNGIDSDAYVQYSEVVGATDTEPDIRYRERVIYVYQNPVALFNKSAIVSKCQEIAGVTRVFVQECTPAVGMVTVYFTRDDEIVIIPTSENVQQVKERLLTIKPSNTADTDVIVLAPTPVLVNFEITSLSPNTVSMQEAIRASLETLFRENTEVGVDLLEAAYMSAIYQTVDLESGDIVRLFTLDSPSGDIEIGEGELPVLGEIVFS